MAKGVTFEAFDLDDVGAHLREQHWTVRAGDIAGEIENEDARERSARRGRARSGGGRLHPSGDDRFGGGRRGRGAGNVAGSGGKIYGDAELHGGAKGWVGEITAHRERTGLRVIDELAPGHHRSGRNVGFAEDAEPFVTRAGADDRLKDVLERLPMLLGDAPWRTLKTRVSDEIGAVEGEGEFIEERGVAAGDEEVIAIGGLEQAIAGDGAERVGRPRLKNRGHFRVAHNAAGLERKSAGEE